MPKHSLEIVKLKNFYSPFTLLIAIVILAIGCKPDRILPPEGPGGGEGIGKSVGKVVFYIENSASIFGYLNPNSNYVNTVAELAKNLLLVNDNPDFEYNFINGEAPCEISHIQDFDSSLNRNSFNVGDVSRSDINEMFSIAMKKAIFDTISIFISDGIYDIGNEVGLLPITARNTRNQFYNALENNFFQTQIIKVNSEFDGIYYYSARSGSQRINQNRPFYIWIFGNEQLVNKYFSEDYLTTKIKGFENYFKFSKYSDSLMIPFQVTPSLQPTSRYRQNRRNLNTLMVKNHRTDEFRFTFAVDFSNMDLPKSYLLEKTNYQINNGFSIDSIQIIDEKSQRIISYPHNATHKLSVSTNGTPYGNLEIKLLNKLPAWIEESSTKNENMIDTIKTFGLIDLMSGIKEAYFENQKNKVFTTFNFTINSNN